MAFSSSLDYLNLKQIGENSGGPFYHRPSPGFFYFEGSENEDIECKKHAGRSCPCEGKEISYSNHIFYNQSNCGACPLDVNLVQDLLNSSRECDDVCFILKLNLLDGGEIVRYRKIIRTFIKEIHGFFAKIKVIPSH